MLGVLAKNIQCYAKRLVIIFLADGVVVRVVTFATVRDWNVGCKHTGYGGGPLDYCFEQAPHIQTK